MWAGLASPEISLLSLQMAVLLLGPHMAFSLCLHTSGVSLPLLRRTVAILVWGPPLWPHLTLITSWKTLPPNTVTLRFRASKYEFWGNTIQSITDRNAINQIFCNIFSSREKNKILGKGKGYYLHVISTYMKYKCICESLIWGIIYKWMHLK